MRREYGPDLCTAASEKQQPAVRAPHVTSAHVAVACEWCGKPATCVGRYEDMTEAKPACDGCCGHGCEDGYCEPIASAGTEPVEREACGSARATDESTEGQR
jgi:hypothetical protein